MDGAPSQLAIFKRDIVRGLGAARRAERFNFLALTSITIEFSPISAFQTGLTLNFCWALASYGVSL